MGVSCKKGYLDTVRQLKCWSGHFKIQKFISKSIKTEKSFYTFTGSNFGFLCKLLPLLGLDKIVKFEENNIIRGLMMIAKTWYEKCSLNIQDLCVKLT